MTQVLAVFAIVLGAVAVAFLLGAFWQSRRPYPFDVLTGSAAARWQVIQWARRLRAERRAARHLRGLAKRGARRIA